MTLKVPLTGTTVKAEGEGPAVNGATAPLAQPTQPPAQQPPGRASLHQVRMPVQQTQVEVRGEFDNHGRVKWVPVEQAQESPTAGAEDVADVEDSTLDARGDALDGAVDVPPLPSTQPQQSDMSVLQWQIADLKQTVQLLAHAQLGGTQQPPAKPAAPTPPDPTQFDFYDAQSAAEFHRLNNAYIQATVRHEVNAALEPHGNALQEAELSRQYNGVLGQHGAEPNFKAVMDAALRLVAKSQQKVSIPEAYEYMASILATSPQQQTAAPSQSAKPAQRTMTAQEAAQKAEQAKRLPASNGVSGTAEPALPANLRSVGALGRIMLHNQQSGRARPIGN